MRANSKQREPQLQTWWQENKVYEGLSQGNTGEPFTLHDGPPYANGELHCGHALNKVCSELFCSLLRTWWQENKVCVSLSQGNTGSGSRCTVGPRMPTESFTAATL